MQATPSVNPSSSTASYLSNRCPPKWTTLALLIGIVACIAIIILTRTNALKFVGTTNLPLVRTSFCLLGLVLNFVLFYKQLIAWTLPNEGAVSSRERATVTITKYPYQDLVDAFRGPLGAHISFSDYANRPDTNADELAMKKKAALLDLPRPISEPLTDEELKQIEERALTYAEARVAVVLANEAINASADSKIKVRETIIKSTKLTVETIGIQQDPVLYVVSLKLFGLDQKQEMIDFYLKAIDELRPFPEKVRSVLNSFAEEEQAAPQPESP